MTTTPETTAPFNDDLTYWHLRHPGADHHLSTALIIHASPRCAGASALPLPSHTVDVLWEVGQDAGTSDRGIGWCEVCAIAPSDVAAARDRVAAYLAVRGSMGGSIDPDLIACVSTTDGILDLRISDLRLLLGDDQ